MTAARALQMDDWVVHRPNVVRSVAARVPGIDAEEAASRALEKMVRLVSTGTTIDDPAPYWRRAAVNEAISMTREAGRTRPVEDDTLDGLTPPVAGAELDSERQADVTMLRDALTHLADDDRQILLERHVHDRAVSDIATNLGVRPHAVTMRLRRAEERLAGAFAAAHAQHVNEPECRTTRAAMHDYLKGRLLPRRQRRLEVHMDGCAECTRAFIDVREVSWMLRDLGQHVIAAAVATGALGAAVGAGAAAGGAAGAGAGAGVGAGAAGAGAGAPRSFGKKEAAIVAGVLAVLALGGGAMALVANQADEPPAAESVPNPGAGGGGDGAGGGGAGAGAGGGGGDGSGEGEGDGAVAGTGTDGAGGDASSGDAGGDAGAGAGGDGNGDGGGARGADSGIGADVADWLARLGIGDGPSADDGGSGEAPDTGGSGTDTGKDRAADDEPGDGDSDGDSDGNGDNSARSDGRSAPDDGSTDGGGPATADGTNPGVGAQVTDWLARLGAIGIPGFLLIVFLLWLWERWSRAEED
ncbi:sigma-70 family RNA polymerase sigma factor [Promicromonospora sp. NPDC023987]|uniref:RNA polymerase sigma factor n=1 Tax=Promicromonospora sp. NPDC023987 TaxID=3155360 RepID=UPI0033CDF8C9